CWLCAGLELALMNLELDPYGVGKVPCVVCQDQYATGTHPSVELVGLIFPGCWGENPTDGSSRWSLSARHGIAQFLEEKVSSPEPLMRGIVASTLAGLLRSLAEEEREEEQN